MKCNHIKPKMISSSKWSQICDVIKGLTPNVSTRAYRSTWEVRPVARRIALMKPPAWNYTFITGQKTHARIEC